MWSFLFVRLELTECGCLSAREIASNAWLAMRGILEKILLSITHVSLCALMSLIHPNLFFRQVIHVKERVEVDFDFHSKTTKLMEEAQYAT